MSFHNDLESLEPEMREKIKALITRCELAGCQILVNETLREQTTQNAYYAQGRQSLVAVNSLRHTAGLWHLTETENRQIITDSLDMVYKGVGHGNGTAFDIVPLRNGKAYWSAPRELWEKIGLIGEGLGLVWGGRWGSYGSPKWDGPHFQLKREGEK